LNHDTKGSKQKDSESPPVTESSPPAKSEPSVPAKKVKGRLTRNEVLDVALRACGTTREKLSGDLIRTGIAKLTAKTTKFFSYKGEVLDEREVDAHDINLQAVRVLGEMLDQFGSRSSEEKQAPNYVFVFPTWAGQPGPQLTSASHGGGGALERPASEAIIDQPDPDLDVL